MRHFGNGPMWKTLVVTEVDDCRRDWYYNILYLNDYVDHSQCLAHTWYLAADFHLTLMGLLIFCLIKCQRARKIAISAAFAVGVVAAAAEVYFRNLHGMLLVTPEAGRHFFAEDPTFNHMYKRGHTNIVCYAMGLALGVWIYNLIMANFNVTKYKKYRFIYWASPLAGLLIIISGGIFYTDGIEVPLVVKAVYSPLVKMTFGMLGAILLMGTLFKLENVYRGILEWRGWAVFGRLSYCVYLLHESIIRIRTANHTTLLHSNFFQILLNFFGLLVTVVIVAFPFWMLIEAPFGQLVRICFYPASKKDPEANENGAAPVLVIKKELDANETFQSKT